MSSDKLPPHSIEAEEAVLGSLLVDPDSIVTIAPWLISEDFYDERDRWAYSACIALYERSDAINQITMAEELDRQGKLQEMGGMAYLSHMVSILPTSVHLEYYADIVHRLSIMRRLINAGERIAALGYEADPDVDAVIAKAENIVFKVRRGQRHRDFVHISHVLEEFFEESSSATSTSTSNPVHTFTGFTKLDEILGGLQRSDLIILAARPSLGKSSLALAIARNAAIQQGAHVAIFSLEMGNDQLVHRLISGDTGIDSKRVRLGQYTEQEEQKIINATGILSEAPIFLDDSPTMRTAEIRSKTRRLHDEHGVDLLIVDYLQLIQGNGKIDNRVQEISEISRSLKIIARELDVPVIAVSQLSRAVEMRTPHIPMLSDLRESGSIEQDADVVLFIYRDDVYCTEEEWNRKNPDQKYPKGIANIIVAKHRNGPTGQINLQFEHSLAKFNNLATDYGEGDRPANEQEYVFGFSN